MTNENKAEEKKLLTKRDKGGYYLAAKDLRREFEKLGLKKIDKNTSESINLDWYDVNQLVTSFSYANRDKSATLDDFIRENKLEVTADSLLAKKGIDPASITITPLANHRTKDVHPNFLPTKEGFVKLDSSNVGEFVSAGPGFSNDKKAKEPGAKPDTYVAKLRIPGIVAKDDEYVEITGVGLKDVFEDPAGNAKFKAGDVVAVAHTGFEQVNGSDGQLFKKKLFNAELIEPSRMSEAKDHYANASNRYLKISRVDAGKFGLDTFTSEVNGQKSAVFQYMTLEHFNQARGASPIPSTLKEADLFKEQKKEFLQSYEGKSEKPTLEDFAKKYNYEIFDKSDLSKDANKQLPVVAKGEPKKVSEANAENTADGEGKKPQGGSKYPQKQSFAPDKKDPANRDHSDNPAMNHQEKQQQATMTLGAVLGQKVFAAAGTALAFGKENIPRVGGYLIQSTANMVDGIKNGWQGYSAEHAMHNAFSPRYKGNPLSNEILKNQLESQILEAYDNRLQSMVLGKDVRDADREFLDKTDRLYGVDSKEHPRLQQELNHLMIQSDKELVEAEPEQKQAVKERTQMIMKNLYGQYAGGTENLDNPKFAQNAARLDALDKGLDAAVGQAYEERLQRIAGGEDVRLADEAFNQKLKQSFGMREGYSSFDQEISDKLLAHDKNRLSVDDEGYAKQFKENLKDIKNSFAKESEIFEVVATTDAKKSLSKETFDNNPNEMFERLRASKKNVEAFELPKKDKEDSLAFKIGEKMGSIFDMLTQVLQRFKSGPSGPGNGPSGP